jgi:hypothetical protein
MNSDPPEGTDTPVELIANPDPKPGLKSTEFWMIAAANIIAVALALLGKIEAQWAVGAVTVLNALYAVLRNQLKTTTAKESSKLFTWLLLLAAGALLLPACTTVTTRTTAPDGTVTEVITKAADPATVQAITTAATAIAVDRASSK